MDKLKKNKKAVMVVVIFVLALLAGGTYVATRNTDSHNKAKTTTQSEEKAKKVKEDRKEEKEAEKALEEAKASGDEKAIKEAEAKVEKAQAKTKAASQSSTPSTDGSSSPATPKPAEKKKVWVVDKAAWTETVTKYRTEKVTKYYYGGQYFDDYESGYAAYLQDAENGNPKGSLSPVNVDIQVPYQETVNHPEEGHWEYR